MLNFLINSPRWFKKIIFLLHDSLMIFISFWLAFGLRLPIKGEWINIDNWKVLFITSVISLIVFTRIGLYQAVIRYAGERILNTIAIGCFISITTLLATAFYLHIPLPRSVPIMYVLLLLVFMIGSRFTLKGFLQARHNQLGHPVIIYGAGESGRQLLGSIMHTDAYYPVAFVDDNPSLHDIVIDNKKVYASSQLEKLISQYNVKSILLAIPSATNKQRKKIIQKLSSLPCKILSMPGLKDLVEGKVNVKTLTKISIIDLLGRDAISPIPSLMTNHQLN